MLLHGRNLPKKDSSVIEAPETDGGFQEERGQDNEGQSSADTSAENYPAARERFIRRLMIAERLSEHGEITSSPEDVVRRLEEREQEASNNGKSAQD